MSDDDKPRKGKSVELRGHVRLSFTATHRVLPNLPLELSTAPHPEGLRIVAQFAEQTDEETRAAEEAGRFAMRPLVGFVLYPPAPLTEDEAAARLAAITADLWAAADAAHRAGLADERTDPVVRHVVEHSYTFTDDGKRLPIPPDLVRARLAAVDAGDAAHRRLQELLGMGEADAGDAVAGEPVPPGAPATDAEMFALSLVAGMVAPLFMPPDYPALTYMDPLPKKRGRPRRGPEVVPQQTSPEFEAVIFGVVVDGRTATKDTGDAAPWQDVAGEVALTHKRKGSPLSLHFGASAVDDPTRDFVPLRATSPAELRELLEQVAGPRTAHLYNYTLVRAREELDGYTVSIDELVNASGPRPRSGRERDVARREVWDALRLLAHVAVYGRRKAYAPKKGEPDILATRGPLVAFLEVADNEQLSLDGSNPPREVTLIAGPWLARLAAENPAALPYATDDRTRATLPGAQPRHAWADGVGWAYVHLSRIDAKNANERGQGVDEDGQEKPTKMQVRDFTRRELLDYLNPEPHYADILAGPHPLRAVKLWDDMRRLLQQRGVWGSGRGDYVEHGPAPWHKPKDWPKGKLYNPKGWGDGWLDERLTIRPGPQGQDVVRTMKAKADATRDKAAKTRARNRAAKKGGQASS